MCVGFLCTVCSSQPSDLLVTSTSRNGRMSIFHFHSEIGIYVCVLSISLLLVLLRVTELPVQLLFSIPLCLLQI
jgi:hypothetical protein